MILYYDEFGDEREVSISIAQPFKAGWKEMTIQGEAVYGLTRKGKGHKWP